MASAASRLFVLAAASLALAATASGSASSPARKKPEAAQELEAGLQLLKGRRYDEAIERFKGALALDPPQALAAEILYEIGNAHFRKGQDAFDGRLPGIDPEPSLREAVKAFEDLLRRHPKEEKTPSGGFLLGTTYVLLDDLEKALASYRRVYDEFSAFPNRSLALLRAGVCQAGLDDSKTARETFAKYLKEFPDKTSEADKVRKYLLEQAIVGRRAAPLRDMEWLRGSIDEEGLEALEGQVVVLFFFATWCPNCRKELPHLRSLMQRWAKDGVFFIGVANPDDPQAAMPVEEYVRRNDLPFFDVALDRTSSTRRPYQVSSFPAAVIIDRSSSIRWRGHPAFFPNSLVGKILEQK